MTHSLVLQLLGPPRVLLGMELALPTRKSLALTAFVALCGETTRSRLAALLWSDQPEEAARRNLRQELHRLNATPVGPWIQSSGEHLSLRPDADVDVENFRRAIADKDLAQAGRLYRGPLLSRFELKGASGYMDWLGTEREALARAWREATAARAKAAEAQGDPKGALELFRALIVEDPLAESHHREAMRLLDLLGDRGAALAQFESLRGTLRADLALDPLPETEALARRIRKGPAKAGHAQADAPAPVLHSPLVGRESAWAALDGAGQRLALIEGEPGIGKTRLAREFAAAHGDLVVLKGREISRETPFYPVAEALLEAYRADSGWYELLDPVWRAEIARFVPMLAEGEPGGEPPSLEGRARVLEALAAALVTAARGGFLLFDDLQWFDGSSAELVSHVTRRAGRVRLLATVRAEDLAGNPAVQRSLAAIGRDELLARIPLAALTESDVLTLVRALSGSTGATVFAQRLHAATAGNPLFLLETLRDLFGAGVLWREADTWATPYDDETEDYRELPISPSVREAVLRRIDRLGEGSRRLLEAACLAGDGFLLDWIGGCTALSELELVDAAERAMEANVIVEGPVGHRFTHDLIRRSLDDALTAERRKLLHRKLAAAMIASGSVGPADVASHLEAGGRALDAVSYRVRAAEAALRACALPEALALYGIALSDGAAGSEAFRIHGARCEVYRNLADEAGRTASLEAMAAIADSTDEPSLRVELAIKQSIDHFEHDRYDAAMRTVESALRGLQGRIDDFDGARLRLELGATFEVLGRIDEAEAMLGMALETFRDTSPVKFANAAYWLCQCAIKRGDLASAEGFCDLSLEASGRAGYRRGHALSLSTSADLAFRQDDVAGGLERLGQAHREAREIGSLALERAFREALAVRLRQAGRHDEAAVLDQASVSNRLA